MKYKNLPKYNEGMHFVTTKTYQNNTYFLDKTCCDILVEELDFYRKKYGFKIPGYGIMPDHLHLLVWWDVEKDKELTISKIVQGIKSVSAKRIIDYIGVGRSTCSYPPNLNRYIKNPDKKIGIQHTGQKYKIWQPGFYDYSQALFSYAELGIAIHSLPMDGFNGYEEKFVEKLEYIHNNQFQDKRIKDPENYLYSSMMFYEKEKGALKIDIV
jgi:putative transposase